MTPLQPGHDAAGILLVDQLLAQSTEDGVTLSTTLPADQGGVLHVKLDLSHYAACRLRFWLNQVLE